MPRILIVEDEELIRQLYADFLEKKGYKAETAENGQKALDYLSDTRPDLILLDMNMPELNGKELLKIMKAEDGLKDIPVLMITGVDDVRVISECLTIGAIGYIEKCTSLIEVVNNIEIVLGTIIGKPGSNSFNQGPRNLTDLNLDK